MQAILLLLILLLYGSFLCIRGIVRMYKEREIKALLLIAGLYLSLPLLIWGLLSLSRGRMNIWFALPVGLLGALWVGLGYLLAAYMRLQKKRKMEGLVRVRPQPPARHMRNNALQLAASLALWLWGALIGIGNAIAETCALGGFVFFLARSLISLWRYRRF